MSKPIAGSFTPLPTIKHSSGYQFQQRGDRVYVEREDGLEIASFLPAKLQETTSWKPVYLTTQQLETAARLWLAENQEA